ncbi:hypothetical protein HIM_09827 [Hirsutella minnesotensis 3608]|uniref:EKC/KEOPS complex subunit BUD32 n=1 Tax=Hirsutella minnesotensis 3608 TaxID=1043627 RepID=A0A0F7ZXI4_9HYPO|nr:hypothetical protein HIM_09827 [Hirsutella minnesotensis 3608]
MSAKSITDVYPIDGLCAVNVDFGGKEYRICWSGNWRNLPDLSTFPDLTGATITEIAQSLAMRQVWTQSEVIAHGADSHIRELRTCSDDFPICKVANDWRQRQAIRDEFFILRRFSELDANIVVPRTHPDPLRDDEGIFGFRMERLQKIPWGHSLSCLPALRKAVQQLHQARVIHFDLSPNNCMVNKYGNLIIIDFGRGGLIDNPVPLHKQKGPKRNSEMRYSIEQDLEGIERLKGTLNTWQQENRRVAKYEVAIWTKEALQRSPSLLLNPLHSQRDGGKTSRGNLHRGSFQYI